MRVDDVLSASVRLGPGSSLIGYARHPARRGTTGLVVRLADGQEVWTLDGSTVVALPRDWRGKVEWEVEGRPDPMMVQIRIEADKQGISQAEVARRIGVSPQSLGKYWTGDRRPGAGLLARMADAVGCRWVLSAKPKD